MSLPLKNRYRVSTLAVVSASVLVYFSGALPGTRGKNREEQTPIEYGLPGSPSAQTPEDGAWEERLSEAVFEPMLEPARAQPSEPGATRYHSKHLDFRLQVNGLQIPYQVLALTTLPGERLRIDTSFPEGRTFLTRLYYGAGAVEETAFGQWQWTAPQQPGIYPLRVARPQAKDSAQLNILVLTPRELVNNEVLNGYRIGQYQEKPLRGERSYLPPSGFVELAPANDDILLSPHFTLGQLACKQPGNPRYLAVTLPLVLKLEAILEEVNRRGRPASTLHVMSGFRTPDYNRAIGNRTTYSRHLWGDAADIFVDEDGDGEMDDWNRDGRSDYRDARILFSLAEMVEGKTQGLVQAGGLGLYRRNTVRGPFVHVDSRGRRARW